MGIDISVIIPTYNEEENVTILYKELTSVLCTLNRDYKIIFVDDCSTDATYRRLSELHAHDAHVKIIKFRKNFGQSAAMKAGFDQAEGNIIITLDADLQNDPHDIPQMLEKLEKEDYDVVCGWRYNRKDPFFKKIFSLFANSFRAYLTGETIHDSGCTLRVYKQEAVKDIELNGELHRYIPALLLWKGYRIGEVKTNHRLREFGKSKYTWKRLTKGFLDLLVIAFWQKYSVRPMHIFGGSGLIIGGIGLLLSLYLGLSRILFGTGLTDRPLFLVALVLLVVGIQFVALGIIADILLRIYYGQNERKNYLIDEII
ncbi:glycosyltransferase family 2 protein [Methanoregula sp.]|jgi:glycosyltransferase involved in cell wall biosynthesis|uniref:glycosyltransferase family 2 protein n=1 Tax=Methanoregula sp. TaxID=2052170 RepID=UPI003568B742